MTLCLIDTNIFLCLAFEDPGYQHCGKLLDQAFKGDFTLLLSSVQITELLTPFYRARDHVGLEKMKKEIIKLEPKVRNVDQQIAEKAAQYRSTVKTPNGGWLALADSIILATAVLEKAKILYTIDTDFLNIKEIKIKAPGMKITDWMKQYGSPKRSDPKIC